MTRGCDLSSILVTDILAGAPPGLDSLLSLPAQAGRRQSTKASGGGPAILTEGERVRFAPIFSFVVGVLLVSSCVLHAERPRRSADLPNAPSDLTAVLHPEGVLTLEWRDNSAEETAFLVVEDCDGSPGRVIGTVGRDHTRVEVHGMPPETTCSFAVFALNDAGLSGSSNIAIIANVSPEPRYAGRGREAT